MYMYLLYIYIYSHFDMLATWHVVLNKETIGQEFELPDVVGCVLSTRLKDLGWVRNSLC